MAKTSMKLKQQWPAKFSTRAYTRCKICGRPHSVLRKYGVCRICFRELAVRNRARTAAGVPAHAPRTTWSDPRSPQGQLVSERRS